MIKLKPLSDKVIIKPIEENETTKFGIVLPETVEKEKKERGKIIAIGPGKLLENGQRAQMSVKVGDVIIFKKYAADDLEIDKEKFLVVGEEDIIGIIES